MRMKLRIPVLVLAAAFPSLAVSQPPPNKPFPPLPGPTAVPAEAAPPPAGSGVVPTPSPALPPGVQPALPPGVHPAPPIALPATPPPAVERPVPSPECILIIDNSKFLIGDESTRICWTMSHLLDALPENTPTAVILIAAVHVEQHEDHVLPVRSLDPLRWGDKFNTRQVVCLTENRGPNQVAEALRLAQKMLFKAHTAKPRVVLLTAGRGLDYKDAFYEAQQMQNIKPVDFVVFGYNDDLNTQNHLEELARKGQGEMRRIQYLKDIPEVAKIVTTSYQQVRDQRAEEHRKTIQRLHNLHFAVIEAEGTIHGLKKELVDCETTKCAVLVQLGQKEKELQGCCGTVADLTQKLCACEKQVGELCTKLLACEQENATLKAQIKKLIADLAQANADLKACKEHVKTLEETNKKLHADVVKLTTQVNDQRVQIAELQKDKENLTKDLSEEKKLTKKLSDELKAARAEIAKLQQENATLIKEKTALTNASKQLAEKLHVEEKKTVSLGEKLTACKEDAKKTNDLLTTANTTIKTLEGQIDTLHKIIGTQKTKIEGFERDNQTLVKENQKSQEELKLCSIRLTTCTDENKLLSLAKIQLTNDLDNTKKDLNFCREERVGLTTKVDFLTKELMKCEMTLASLSIGNEKDQRRLDVLLEGARREAIGATRELAIAMAVKKDWPPGPYGPIDMSKIIVPQGPVTPTTQGGSPINGPTPLGGTGGVAGGNPGGVAGGTGGTPGAVGGTPGAVAGGTPGGVTGGTPGGVTGGAPGGVGGSSAGGSSAGGSAAGAPGSGGVPGGGGNSDAGLGGIGGILGGVLGAFGF